MLDHIEGVVLQHFRASIARSSAALDVLFRVQVEPFDLLLSSMHLPVASGFEIVRNMRNYPTNKHTPALILTPSHDDRHTRLAHKLGVCQIFPDDAHLLSERIVDYWLQGKTAQTESVFSPKKDMVFPLQISR